MKRFETAIRKREIFLIPTFGLLMQHDYMEENKYLRIAVAWLCFRASIIVWEGKMYE